MIVTDILESTCHCLLEVRILTINSWWWRWNSICNTNISKLKHPQEYLLSTPAGGGSGTTPSVIPISVNIEASQEYLLSTPAGGSGGGTTPSVIPISVNRSISRILTINSRWWWQWYNSICYIISIIKKYPQEHELLKLNFN